jgi:hypothetical protein
MNGKGVRVLRETGRTILSEEKEHIALMDWVRWHPILRHLMIHIPNEGRRSVQYAVKMKRMGLRKGVSDFFLPLPKGKFHGLWVELKRDSKAKKTEEQIEWLNKMRSLDYAAYFAYGFESAKDIITMYLDNKL